MRKYLIIAMVFALALMSVGAGCKKNNSSDDSSQNSQQRTPVVETSTQASGTIVGGDKYIHGCIGSAGYSWCAVKNKCLRPWEEKCEEPVPPIIDKANGAIEISQFNFRTRYPVKYFANVTSSFSGRGEGYDITLESKLTDSTAEKGKIWPSYVITISVSSNTYKSRDLFMSNLWTYVNGETQEGEYKKVNYAGYEWIEGIGTPGVYKFFALTTASKNTVITLDLGTFDMKEFSSVPNTAASREALDVYKQMLNSIIRYNF